MRAIAFLCQIFSLVLSLGAIIVMLAYYVYYKDKRVIRLIAFLFSFLCAIVVINIPFLIRSFSAHYISYLDYVYFYLFLTYSFGLVFYSYPSFILEMVAISISRMMRVALFSISFLPLYLYIWIMLWAKNIHDLSFIRNILGFLLFTILLLSLFILLKMHKKLIGLWRKVSFIFIIFTVFYLPIAVIDLFIPRIRLIDDEFFPFSTIFFLALNLAIICRVLIITLRRNRRETPDIPKFDGVISLESCAKFGISERECEIAAAILAGKTNNEIAREKSISLTTVKKHVYNIFQKTKARNRIELTNILRNGK